MSAKRDVVLSGYSALQADDLAAFQALHHPDVADDTVLTDAPRVPPAAPFSL